MSATATNLVAAADSGARSAAVESYILHHIADSDRWHLPHLFEVQLQLPTFSLHALMLVLAAGFLIFLCTRFYDRKATVQTGVGNFLEIMVLFIRNEICINCLGEEDGRRMTPLFCSFFFFILTLNLMGLVPVFASATANVSVTGGLAAVTLFFMIFGAIQRNGVKGFIGAFVLPGVPWPVLVLVVPLEFAGMFIKSFALTVRLFANMMAGHIIISALVGLAVVFGLAALPALAMAVAMYFLKILVCFIQAYIFTLLSAMFIGQIYHPAH